MMTYIDQNSEVGGKYYYCTKVDGIIIRHTKINGCLWQCAISRCSSNSMYPHGVKFVGKDGDFVPVPARYNITVQFGPKGIRLRQIIMMILKFGRRRSKKSSMQVVVFDTSDFFSLQYSKISDISISFLTRFYFSHFCKYLSSVFEFFQNNCVE